jgi:hypothetical protein
VPAPSFFFKLELSSDAASEALLDDLASQVLRSVGCSPREVPGLEAALAQATAAAAAARRCDLRFRLENGALEIVVFANGGCLYQTSHPISEPS